TLARCTVPRRGAMTNATDPGSRAPNFLNSRSSTTEYTAVVTATPAASDSTAKAVNNGEATSRATVLRNSTAQVTTTKRRETGNGKRETDAAGRCCYNGTKLPMSQSRASIIVERVQTGVRLEKRMLKVLKALADSLDITLGDLIEGIVLHAIEGKAPFSKP